MFRTRGPRNERPATSALVRVSLIACLFSACALAVRAERRREVVGRWDAPVGRRCAPDATPLALPAAATLVDSAALARALATPRISAPIATGEAIVSLAFDSLGALAREHVVQSSLAPAAAESVAALVARRVKVQPPGAAWGVRLLVSSGRATAVVRVGRRVGCAAAPADPQRIARGLRMPSLEPAVYERPPAPVSGGWMSGAPYHRPVRLRALVGATGEVATVRLLNSSGMRASDEAIVLSAYGREFLPALEDGAPTEAWVVMVY